MNYERPKNDERAIIIENLADFYDAIQEYYDELFPISEKALPFFLGLKRDLAERSPVQPAPMVRYLGLGCAAGNLENKLQCEGFDVTGVDANPRMIETAKRRMKRGSMNLRFFEMPIIDIGRFLKQGSFNVIACLDDVLPYISSETLLRKFFHDAKGLLAPNGALVVETINYDAMSASEPTKISPRESIRVKLDRAYFPAGDGALLLEAALEQGNGTTIHVNKSVRVFPLTKRAAETYAREAGFSEISVFGDFDGREWTAGGEKTVIVLK